MQDNERWIDGVRYGGYNGVNSWMIEYPQDRPGEEYEILPSAFQIVSSAFARSKYLRRVVIPASVRDCGYHVFAGSRMLESVICHGNHIGKYAFVGCQNLRSLELYGDAVYLDSSAVAECPNLRHIVIHPGAAMTSQPKYYSRTPKLWYVCTEEVAREYDFRGRYIAYSTWLEMNETLEQFKARTAFVHERLDVSRRFTTSAGLLAKVDESGALKPYIGDTVIFDLNDGTKAWLSDVQGQLYAACGHFTLFSEPLDPASFHITLHDLCSGTMENAPEILDGMKARDEDMTQRIADFRQRYEKRIRLRVKGLMNMMGTSVVLAFEPVDEDDWGVLCDMYMWLQQVVNLPYKLTPHVTLAYYRPDANGYGEDVTQALQQVIDEVNAQYGGREIELSLSALHYSCFADMNCYCSREELVERVKGD